MNYNWDRYPLEASVLRRGEGIYNQSLWKNQHYFYYSKVEVLWIDKKKWWRKLFWFSEKKISKDKKDELRKDESWKIRAKRILVYRKKKNSTTIHCTVWCFTNVRVNFQDTWCNCKLFHKCFIWQYIRNN